MPGDVQGAPVQCPVARVLVPVDSGAPEPSVPDASSPSADAGDPYTSPITFTGTVTGTVPPGASFIRVEVDYVEHVYSSISGGPLYVFDAEQLDVLRVPDLACLTLPANYSIPGWATRLLTMGARTSARRASSSRPMRRTPPSRS